MYLQTPPFFKKEIKSEEKGKNNGQLVTHIKRCRIWYSEEKIGNKSKKNIVENDDQTVQNMWKPKIKKSVNQYLCDIFYTGWDACLRRHAILTLASEKAIIFVNFLTYFFGYASSRIVSLQFLLNFVHVSYFFLFVLSFTLPDAAFSHHFLYSTFSPHHFQHHSLSFVHILLFRFN